MSIIEKLKLTTYKKKAILHLPDEEKSLLSPLEPFDTELKNQTYDLVIVFVYTLQEMLDFTKLFIKAHTLSENGYLYFAYPKKGNKRIATHIDRDVILPSFNAEDTGYVYDSNLKFSRMVSMNEVFTTIGLKQNAKGKNKKPTAASQISSDYESFIPQLFELLTARNETVATFYQKLTPGYKRGWARYIFSAKQASTQEKRLLEAIEIMSNGYKSRELVPKNK